MADDSDQMQDELAALRARVAELEERVARLESREAAPARAVSSSGDGTPAPASREGLADAINRALEQLSEADAGAIRQQLIKSGFASDVARSEVNKTLYAQPALFQVARQEGAKPIWKLAKATQDT